MHWPAHGGQLSAENMEVSIQVTANRIARIRDPCFLFLRRVCGRKYNGALLSLRKCCLETSVPWSRAFVLDNTNLDGAQTCLKLSLLRTFKVVETLDVQGTMEGC